MTHAHAYGFGAIVDLPYDVAVERVRAELAGQGFGVLTEIDVKATLKKKLDIDFRRYTILGACNPPFAHQALQTDLEIGLLLPCNVIVYETDGDRSVISFMDPEAALGLSSDARIAPLAMEVKDRLSRALAAITE